MLVGRRLKEIARRKAQLVLASDMDRAALGLEAGSLKASVSSLSRLSGWAALALDLARLVLDLKSRPGR